jgi:hypothetical protein
MRALSILCMQQGRTYVMGMHCMHKSPVHRLHMHTRLGLQAHEPSREAAGSTPPAYNKQLLTAALLCARSSGSSATPM